MGFKSKKKLIKLTGAHFITHLKEKAKVKRSEMECNNNYRLLIMNTKH